jgi:hypothetical protein
MTNTYHFQEFQLAAQMPTKAALFAVPVIIHPQLARQSFSGCALLPHFKAVHDSLGEILEGPDGAQSWVLLDRIVSPTFIAQILSGNEEEAAMALVAGHLRELEDPFFTLEEYLHDPWIDESKHVIGFMAGAMYRQDEDPNPIEMRCDSRWHASAQRRVVEALISEKHPILRHLVLEPAPLRQALASGFEGLARMYLDLNGNTTFDAEIEPSGKIVLKAGRDGQSEQLSRALAHAPLAPAQMQELLVRMNALARSPCRVSITAVAREGTADAHVERWVS